MKHCTKLKSVTVTFVTVLFFLLVPIVSPFICDEISVELQSGERQEREMGSELVTLSSNSASDIAEDATAYFETLGLEYVGNNQIFQAQVQTISYLHIQRTLEFYFGIAFATVGFGLVTATIIGQLTQKREKLPENSEEQLEG